MVPGRGRHRSGLLCLCAVTDGLWHGLRSQRDPIALAMVAVAFVGIWLILAPDKIAFRTANLWGLASGISASVSIVYLNISRRCHDTNTVLFFMFGIGTVVMAALFHTHFFWPDAAALGWAGWVGGFLLFVANAVLVLRRAHIE
jgi:drug/metabolite transporter (DMT)-like permease